ncbi:flagellar biosynthesis protein FlgG [Oceanidesulfovibrio indonesiensis]|jgi:flagellar basal-body rod protein FlgC|uniref:Flagellar biosynthesis protein FlgG n=1 Tax=Oceanidesulfovibrio indonesiensis TaxID=54767 RepID=A0A7M3MI54_9BACT|nr:flagellar basal body rod C-terminal domain-containing protein [Oceanidesulfovibrio indonesiensis]TVM18848.1 flagellar biosynthesis protein FlgG [Oceanidesulfovibrio indonesiensis]
MPIDIGVSALNAYSTRAQVTANNIANVNTDGFKASRADLETGPGGQGVQVSAIMEDTSTGPMVQSLVPTADPLTGRIETEYQWVEGSNTDISREMVTLMTTERAYAANATTIRTWDEMVGTVLDEIA